MVRIVEVRGSTGARSFAAAALIELAARKPLSIPKLLKCWILVTLYDCEKHASRVESSESHLADGTVKSAKATNTGTWLHSETDPGRDFVCAWKTK